MRSVKKRGGASTDLMTNKQQQPPRNIQKINPLTDAKNFDAPGSQYDLSPQRNAQPPQFAYLNNPVKQSYNSS